MNGQPYLTEQGAFLEGGGRFFGKGKHGFKERRYMRNETWGRGWRRKGPRMDEKGSTDGKKIAPVGVGNIPLMKQKRRAEWKRNSSQDCERMDEKDPRMEQQIAPPHETEKAHRIEEIRRPE